MHSRSLEPLVRRSPASPAQDVERRPSRPSSPLLQLQHTHGNRFVADLVRRGAVDAVTREGEEPGQAIDAVRAVQRTNGSGSGSGAAPVANTAVPTNWQQIVTSWTGGPTRYGFQVKFRCSSSTGSVADLVARPNLVWGEYVTYGVRNDFAHRFTPVDPTITPVPPAPFTGATVVSTNVLELTGYTDTHWFPNTAVREADFTPPATRTLPAVLVSNQIYRYSTDGGTSWATVAGPFTLTRTFYRTPSSFFGLFGGNLRFTTAKTPGIHSVDEAYKP